MLQPILNAQVSSLVSRCKSNTALGEYIQCLRAGVRPLLKYFGILRVLTVLELVSIKQSGTAGKVDCHDEAHIIGEEAVNIIGDFGKAIVQCNSTCGFGCFHGVSLAAFRKKFDLVKNLDLMCADFEHQDFPGQQMTACRHGIGHGLADLAQRDLKQAMQFCDGFASDIGKTECATGVFMELMIAPVFGQRTEENPQDIMLFCKELDGVYERVCLINSGSYIFRATGEDTLSFNVCNSLAHDLQHDCYTALGSDFHFVLQADLPVIASVCNKTDDFRVACYEGALISGLVTDPTGSLGKTLCSFASQDVYTFCTEYLTNAIKRI